MHPGRPSDTAILIARCTLLAARDPARRVLVPPGAEAPLAALLAADGNGGWFNFALRHAWIRAALGAVERLTLPGIITHYLARKRWIEVVTRQALERGVTQVIVLGAGFDTLAWRLHRELPAVHFFELDHPATQAPKQRAPGAAGNLTFLPVDLATGSPAAVLRACPAFSTVKPTLIIAEGLLMYFPETRVAALLRELAVLTRPPVEMIFTFMAQSAVGSINFRQEHAAVSWWLRWRREPFQWGIARAALPDFLQRRGLKLAGLADHDVLRAQILAPLGLARLPLARGECLCHSLTPHSPSAGLLVNDTLPFRRARLQRLRPLQPRFNRCRRMNPLLPVRGFFTAALALLLGGCATVNRVAVNKLGDALAGGGTVFASDNDPALIRDAAPFSLKLMESLLAESPNHRGLRLAAASGFTQYAYAFVQQEAEALEETDVAAAAALRTRARRLYLRGRDHGLRGLESVHCGFGDALRRAPRSAVQVCTRADVPLLYWTAAAWASAITNGKDQPKLIADLPAVEALIDRACELDEAFDAGAIHSFLTAYELSRPGGSGDPLLRSRAHYERALTLSGGAHAGPLLTYAENVCVRQQDRAQFESLLHQALAIDPDARPEWRLVNLVLQTRARRLLARTDDLFLATNLFPP